MASAVFCNPVFPEKNRSPVSRQKSVPDQPGKIFNRDHVRDLHMKIADRFEKNFRDPVLISKSLIDFRTGIGSRSFAPSVVLLHKPVFNRGSMPKCNSQIDFDLKNGDRFQRENRIAIDPDQQHENASAFSAASHESPVGLSRSSFSIAIVIAIHF